MSISDLKNEMKRIPAPLQPYLITGVDSYEQRILSLNENCEKSDAIMYQFKSNEDVNIKLVPDACIEFLFCCDENRPYAVFNGYHTDVTEISLSGNTTYFGVKPYFGYLGLKKKGINPEELVGAKIPLSELFGKESERALDDIIQAEDFSARIHAFQDYFRKHCIDESYNYSLSGYMSISLCTSRGLLSINDLCEETGYSSRYCRKEFSNRYGISLKDYSTSTRFQSVIQHLSTSEDSVADVASATGFFDESHLNKHFKAALSVTPQQFRRQMKN